MIEIVSFKYEHLGMMKEQVATMATFPKINEVHGRTLQTSGFSYTMMGGGEVLGCAGVLPYWPGRGEAWTILSGDCGKYFISMHKAVKRFLDICPFKRVEATVDCYFEEGHRWIKMLGFELEAPRMRKYTEDGGDYSLYSRIREGA